MARQLGKAPNRKRVSPTYINSIMMIALVLFLLGLVGMSLLQAQMVSRVLKENLGKVSAYLQDDINEVEMLQLRKKIEAEPYARETRYVSKEDAMKLFNRMYNEDPSSVLENNPLPASFEIGLKAEYVENDSIVKIQEQLESYNEVKLVKAGTKMVNKLNEQVQTVGLILLGFALLIFGIVVALIDRSIRLAMYANRFIIRSMKLVGATKWFIVKPYITRGLINGLISGLLAVAALVGVIFFLQTEFDSLKILDEYFKFGLLFLGIILVGVLMSWWSTQRSVSKYLKMQLDELY